MVALTPSSNAEVTQPQPSAGEPMPAGTAQRVLPMKFIVGGVVILLAVAYLAFISLGTSTVYYLTVGELRAKGPSAQIVRVSGKVVPGSITREGKVVRFAVSDGGGQLPVSYSGLVPDIFAENIDVVVEGRYADESSFRATNLLTKCPSKFQPDLPNTA